MKCPNCFWPLDRLYVPCQVSDSRRVGVWVSVCENEACQHVELDDWRGKVLLDWHDSAQSQEVQS